MRERTAAFLTFRVRPGGVLKIRYWDVCIFVTSRERPLRVADLQGWCDHAHPGGSRQS